MLRGAILTVALAAAGAALLTAPGASASGPGNVDLKKAVNYAIDREAMLLQRGAHAGVVNDQNLPPEFPGFADAALYPSRPDIARAQALAGWRPGDPMRPAVLYTCNTGPCIPTAQIVQANLAAIGLAVEIQAFPRAVQFVKAGTRGEPFDLTLESWHIDYYDAHDFMFLLDGGTIRAANNSNFSYYDDSDYNRRFAEALAQPGQARIDALGALDVHVASTTAPRATYMTDYDRQFFSDRIGCHAYHGPTGAMSLTALCLRAGGTPTDKTFRWELDTDIDYVDPALAYYVISWQIEQATCARLVNYPDEGGDAGRRLVPQIAQSMPTVSPDGLTYTFTLRNDFTFSPPSGAVVTPGDFKHALERLLTPQMASPGQAFFTDIAGAAEMLAGRATTLSGVTVDGNTLRITLVRPAGDFLARLAMPFACPLPASVGITPGGLSAPVPSAGPLLHRVVDAAQSDRPAAEPELPGSPTVLRHLPDFHRAAAGDDPDEGRVGSVGLRAGPAVSSRRARCRIRARQPSGRCRPAALVREPGCVDPLPRAQPRPAAVRRGAAAGLPTASAGPSAGATAAAASRRRERTFGLGRRLAARSRGDPPALWRGRVPRTADTVRAGPSTRADGAQADQARRGALRDPARQDADRARPPEPARLQRRQAREAAQGAGRHHALAARP